MFGNPYFQTFSKLFDPKTGNYFQTYFRTISELFLQNFCKFEKTEYFKKISEFQKPNYSETRKNEKFGKFCLTQGIKI